MKTHVTHSKSTTNQAIGLERKDGRAIGLPRVRFKAKWKYNKEEL